MIKRSASVRNRTHALTKEGYRYLVGYSPTISYWQIRRILLCQDTADLHSIQNSESIHKEVPILSIKQNKIRMKNSYSKVFLLLEILKNRNNILDVKISHSPILF